MTDAKLDDWGRLTLPKELRERHGDRYHIVAGDSTHKGFAPRLDWTETDET